MWWKAFKNVFLPEKEHPLASNPLTPSIPINSVSKSHLISEAPRGGIKLTTSNGTRFLQPPAKKSPKSVFICSSSISFRKRIGRIIYGKEGEDILL